MSHREHHKIADAAGVCGDVDISSEDLEWMENMRPLRRGDCLRGPRPCPWVACKYHLFWDQLRAGRVSEPDEMVWSCVLDLADAGQSTMAETGGALGITKQRVEQIERVALRRMRAAAGRLAEMEEDRDGPRWVFPRGTDGSRIR